jgi:outer membrane protein insertion porin family
MYWACLSAAPGQTPAPKPGTLVADVRVQGSNATSTPTVLTYVKTRAGADYNPDLLQEDARALLASKLFADVRVQVEMLSDDRVNVYFLLSDLPNEIHKLEYRGAKHLKDEELNALTHLSLNAPLNPCQNKLACELIVRKYHELGRPLADCILLKGGRYEDTEVIFQITEGPTLQIGEVRFTGNHFVSGDVLATHIRSSQRLLGLFSGDFNADLLSADVSQLLEYYHSFGFHDAAISTEVQYQSDGCTAVIFFHITEGIRYRLKETPSIVGTRRIPRKDELEKVLSMKAHDWYDGKKIKHGEDELRDWFGAQGFDVRVQGVPYFSNESPGLVTVRFEVDDAVH